MGKHKRLLREQAGLGKVGHAKIHTKASRDPAG